MVWQTAVALLLHTVKSTKPVVPTIYYTNFHEKVKHMPKSRVHSRSVTIALGSQRFGVRRPTSFHKCVIMLISCFCQ
jgi:hypothetical protein